MLWPRWGRCGVVHGYVWARGIGIAGMRVVDAWTRTRIWMPRGAWVHQPVSAAIAARRWALPRGEPKGPSTRSIDYRGPVNLGLPSDLQCEAASSMGPAVRWLRMRRQAQRTGRQMRLCIAARHARRRLVDNMARTARQQETRDRRMTACHLYDPPESPRGRAWLRPRSRAI